MAGSLLGPDQIRKVNAAFPALVEHLRALLTADHSGVGLMRVHVQVESFDSDEMAKIFRDLSFISPLEKRALVRAAIYELIAKEPLLFLTPTFVAPTATPADEIRNQAIANVATFTPPQFKINVNKAEDFHGQKPADSPAPAPVVTSTHTPKVTSQLVEGAKQAAAQQEKMDAAVAKLREASAPQPAGE